MPSIFLEHVHLHYPVFVPVTPSGEDSDNPQAGSGVRASGKRRRYVEALKDISFSLESGNRLALVGRNGSGKSTLLRLLGGIYHPTAGKIKIEGSVAPLFNVGLGMRPESTGRRNIILRGLLRGLSAKQAREKVDEIAEFADIGPFLDLPVRTYSTGMAMRLSFAMGTAFSPEILLLDEWIGAGDHAFRDKAMGRMNSLVDNASIAVIASHNRPLLRKVCNTALWLERGVMRAFGPIEEVYAAVDAAYPQKEKPGPKIVASGGNRLG